MKNSSVFLFVLAAAMAGCSKHDSAVMERLVAAEKAASAAQSASDDLRNQIAALRLAVNEQGESPAFVSADESGYGIINTRHGRLVASVESAAPYLDGFKVTLSIGNLTSADFDGAKVHLMWGEKPNEKAFNITDTIRAGAFNNVTVVMSPAKPADLKLFSVGLSLSKVKLRKSL